MARSPRRPNEIGVLLVHGIGEQKVGEALQANADAIISWIRDLKRPSNESQENLRVGVAVLSREEDAPPYLDLEIPRPEGNGQEEGLAGAYERWRLAESHWADAFPPPGMNEVVKWSLPMVPAVVVGHFAQRLSQSGGFSAKLGYGLCCFLFITPIVLVTQITMCALLLLSLIPLRSVKIYLKSLQEKLALVVGDSYVFVQSDSRRAAILHRFRQDLHWLCKRCQRVVVVAHSQGAAIAFDGMRLERPSNVSLFLTLGAGINKLWEVKNYRDSIPVWAPAIQFVLELLTLFAVVGYFSSSSEEFYGLFIVLASSLGLFHLVWAVVRSLRRAGRRPAWPSDLAWLDFYACCDPVANGPMPSEFGCRSSRGIANRGSFLTDHTSYEQNVQQFIGPLVSAICRYGRSSIALHAKGRILARRRRSFFVLHLAIARWAIAVSVALNLWLLPSWFRPVGDVVLEQARAVPFAGWIGAEVTALAFVLVALGLSAYWVYASYWSFVVGLDGLGLQRGTADKTRRHLAGLCIATPFFCGMVLLSPVYTQLVSMLSTDMRIAAIAAGFIALLVIWSVTDAARSTLMESQ